MNLTGAIVSAELQFKQILEEFFISVCNEKTLLSHGIDHHRRVWNYSKELISLLPVHKSQSLSQIPSKLIIACYLHDIGLSVETGTRHGKHSRDFCMKFFSKNLLDKDEYPGVLEAIENHDIKDYPDNPDVCQLLTILSVADDLDAFGFTGIYRYIEINLIRNNNPGAIGYLIKENAAVRYEHFIRNFGFNDELVQKHKSKYEILVNFFTEYNKQLIFYKFGEQKPEGYCGVVELFIKMIKDKNGLKELYRELYIYQDDPLMQWFFNGLKSDLSF